MAEEGYEYADPHAAMSDFVTLIEYPDGSKDFSWNYSAAQKDEKRVAVQDAICKEEVGFWDAVDAAVLAEEERIVEEMLPQLEAVKASHEREMANLENILATLDHS
jgi:hypothetical protein